MKLLWNQIPYTLSDAQQGTMIKLFRVNIEEQYNKLDLQWRLAAKMGARGVLQFLEKKAIGEGSQEAARVLRPPKQADPVLHLFDVGEKLLGDMIAHVTLNFETTASHGPNSQTGTITAFTAEVTRADRGQDGGPLDSDGDIGVRENDSPQVFRPDLHETIP